MNALQSAAGQIGGFAALAGVIGVSPPAVSQWASGHRRVPADRCPAIERATAGRVTVQDLRPDVRWHRVPDPTWPHRDGRPCIDVAAPAAQPAEAPGAEVPN